MLNGWFRGENMHKQEYEQQCWNCHKNFIYLDDDTYDYGEGIVDLELAKLYSGYVVVHCPHCKIINGFENKIERYPKIITKDPCDVRVAVNGTLKRLISAGYAYTLFDFSGLDFLINDYINDFGKRPEYIVMNKQQREALKMQIEYMIYNCNPTIDTPTTYDEIKILIDDDCECIKCL